MTASIHSFPSCFDRDEAEFIRKGTSNYTRALAEGAALWDAAMGRGDKANFEQRIAAFDRSIEHLGRYRSDDLGNLVSLAGGGRIELRAMPAALRQLAIR